MSACSVCLPGALVAASCHRHTQKSVHILQRLVTHCSVHLGVLLPWRADVLLPYSTQGAM